MVAYFVLSILFVSGGQYTRLDIWEGCYSNGSLFCSLYFLFVSGGQYTRLDIWEGCYNNGSLFCSLHNQLNGTELPQETV